MFQEKVLYQTCKSMNQDSSDSLSPMYGFRASVEATKRQKQKHANQNVFRAATSTAIVLWKMCHAGELEYGKIASIRLGTFRFIQ